MVAYIPDIIFCGKTWTMDFLKTEGNIMLKRGSPCESVLKSIRSIIRAVDLQSKTIDLNCGLTGPQLIILKEIQNNNYITTSQLANNISISQSTATIIIDRLVKKQLVERTRDTVDKRKWFLSLTTKAEKILLEAPPPLQLGFIEQFERLPDWEQTQTLATLQRIVAMLNAEGIVDSSPIITSGENLLS